MWLKSRLRPIVFALVLLAGNFTGVPMRREDIEEMLNAHRQVKAEETIQNEQDDDNEDPGVVSR